MPFAMACRVRFPDLFSLRPVHETRHYKCLVCVTKRIRDLVTNYTESGRKHSVKIGEYRCKSVVNQKEVSQISVEKKC